MPRYCVTLTRTAYEYADLFIEADTPEQAEAQAATNANAGSIRWEGVDNEADARVIGVELAEEAQEKPLILP